MQLLFEASCGLWWRGRRERRGHNLSIVEVKESGTGSGRSVLVGSEGILERTELLFPQHLQHCKLPVRQPVTRQDSHTETERDSLCKLEHIKHKSLHFDSIWFGRFDSGLRYRTNGHPQQHYH